MEVKSSYTSFIFEPFILSDWLFVMGYFVASIFVSTDMFYVRRDCSNQLKASESKFISAEEGLLKKDTKVTS